MRRGCIAISEVRCDGCGRIIRHPERYLAINETEAVEVEGEKTLYYCMECSQSRGYAHYEEEKGEWIFTFFPE
jgi:uncharacterized protein with PIN domain